MNKFIIIDAETSIKNRGEDAIGNNKASPFHPDNNIVMFAALELNDPNAAIVVYPNNTSMLNFVEDYRLEDKKHTYVLVGHNIKFDLLYLLKSNVFKYDVFPYIKVWDTQLAEYLLSGHQAKWTSLNQLAEKYGGTQKDDKIKEYWDNNIETEDIPTSQLTTYLLEDIKNTQIVFEHQFEQALNDGMLDLIHNQMEALMATTDMEHNGMMFDRTGAADTLQTLKESATIIKTTVEMEIVKRLAACVVHSNLPEFVSQLPKDLLASNDMLSLFFFGGKYKYTLKEPTGEVYKSGARKGEPRLKNVKHEAEINGLLVPDPSWQTKKAGIYATNEEVLHSIIKQTAVGSTARVAAAKLLNWRELNKDINTYFEPYINLTWPTDLCIHGKLNHTATNTGRLSSSEPNLQNVSNKDE